MNSILGSVVPLAMFQVISVTRQPTCPLASYKKILTWALGFIGQGSPFGLAFALVFGLIIKLKFVFVFAISLKGKRRKGE